MIGHMLKTALAAAAIVVGAQLAVCAQDSTPAVNLLPALPAASDLAGYLQGVRHQHAGQDKLNRPGTPPVQGAIGRSTITRASDGLRVRIETDAGATVQDAQEYARRAIGTQHHSLPAGCPSGRTIGQKVWCEAGDAAGNHRGGFTVVSYDGRAVVKVTLMYTARGLQNGVPVVPNVEAADLRLAEDLAIATLDRLTAMGLTSRRASSASTAAKKRIAAAEKASKLSKGP